VCGTTNKSEAELGLFVKYGDGGVDIEPIAHLYKSQVFRLAKHLGVIPEIIGRAPCPDTYSAPVTDEEWYFRMPFGLLDQLLWAWTNKIAIPEISRALGLDEEKVSRVFRDFSSKHRTTEHLRGAPPSLEGPPAPEVNP
jgi:NAD+ synthase